jgi:transcriptional regulator with XRE-family HTH domain
LKSIYTQEYDRLIHLLVEARKAVPLTQQQLARKLHRPQSFVSKYERGERRLDVVEFIAISRALDVHATSLVSQLEKEFTTPSRRAR